MARIILDSSAIIALARHDPDVRALLTDAVDRRFEVVAPAVVIAETTRGGPGDARVNQILKEIGIFPPVTEMSAREAGRLLWKYEASFEYATEKQRVKRGSATVDALVAAEARRMPPSVVVTSDKDDFRRMLGDERRIEIFSIGESELGE